jgi:hypothetical protein
MTHQKIRILEGLRVINPIGMFAIVLFATAYVLEVPLVLALPLACLSAIIAFTVISMMISIEKRKR